MRLKKIAIKGFLGIDEMLIDPVEPLTLIAGFNETGKSSIAQAVGFAMRGIPERVNLKKEYGQLVNDQHEAAEILVETDVDTRVVRLSGKTGKVDGLPNPENVSAFMHCALDMRYFTDMDDKNRRKVLFALSGIKGNMETVLKMLDQAGCDMDKCKDIKNTLLSGFDGAAKTAKEKASEARGAWKATTGEVYGKEKAETWKAPRVKLDTTSDMISKQLKPIEDEMLEIHHALEEGEKMDSQRDTLEKAIEENQPEGDVDTLQLRADELGEKIRNVMADIDEAKKVHANMGEEPDTQACPECGAALLVEGGTIKVYKSGEYTEADRGKQEKLISSLFKQYEVYDKELVETNKALAMHSAVAKQREQLDNLPPPMPDVQEKQRRYADLQFRRDELKEKLQGVIRAERENEEANAKTLAASRHHQDVQDWLLIEKNLQPDGIPSQLMAKSLDPLNLNLKEQSDIAGWPLVQIDEHMAITYQEISLPQIRDGRSYHLLSESAKWRTQAMLSAAISRIAGIGFILLDRADVLDLAGRSQMLTWAEKLNEQGLQTIICATLKQAPVLPGAKVVWLGGSL